MHMYMLYVSVMVHVSVYMYICYISIYVYNMHN